MQVAITGASGFLGRYLIEVLTAQGHQCRGLSRSVQHDPRVTWVRGSLADNRAVTHLMAGADAVVHAALDRPGPDFQTTGSGTDLVDYVSANVLGSVGLMEAARHAGVERCVIISSGAVHDVILDDRPLDEMHPLWPRSHYGAIKAAIEAFVHSYGKGSGWPVCALRPTAIYGLADPVTTSRWYNLVRTIVRGEPADCVRGSKLVHARDVARATSFLLTAEGMTGEIYHCTDLFVPDRLVAEIARNLARSDSPILGAEVSNRHSITCLKLKKLGFEFGGLDQLHATIAELVNAVQFELKAAT